jgi:hypothetical protein
LLTGALTWLLDEKDRSQKATIAAFEASVKDDTSQSLATVHQRKIDAFNSPSLGHRAERGVPKETNAARRARLARKISKSAPEGGISSPNRTCSSYKAEGQQPCSCPAKADMMIESRP